MSQLKTINSKFTFISDNRQITLIDLEDYLANKSCIPLHTEEESTETIGSFLSSQLTRCQELFPEANELKLFQYLLFNTLLVRELMKTSAPVKVVEFGCTKGDLSYNLTEAISLFHPKSTLCLISNVIGNNSNNTCLDYITQARALPELSMLYCDYSATNLAKNCFDITILNGDIDFEDPYSVIKEAERITKPGGLLFCCSGDNYLLESAFRLIVPEFEEYDLTLQNKFLTARKAGHFWSNAGTEAPYQGMDDLLHDILTNIQESNEPDVFRKHIRQLHSFIDTAIRQNNIEKKLEWMQIKENLLDYMNRQDTEFKDFYKERLCESIDAIMK